ncbi:MAG: hypothetical protein Q4E53_13140 [Eubacteriales bacterium]|nr:hypothetical protein [Eubacteriales bacterium]
MDKKIRQYIGIIVAIAFYYIIHEGAHLVTALYFGVFKRINFLGLGVQIDVVAEKMTDIQMGVFCFMGAVATFTIAVILVLITPNICKMQNKLLKATFYYCSIIMLFLDPIYLSLLCGFFGGGDMNGIKLLIPEIVARTGFGILFIINVLIFVKYILPFFDVKYWLTNVRCDIILP